MGVTKQTLVPGNGQDQPAQGDIVSIHYTGALHDPSAQLGLGKVFDTSAERGPLKTPIGIGRVIQGWDEGVLQMSLGERAILTISSDYGYGAQGFPGLIPPHSTLVFDVNLIDIKRA